VIYILCFWLGVALIGRFTCGFVLLTELVNDRHATFVGTALMVGDGSATLYLTFYYRFISQNSNPTMWAGFALNVVTFIAFFYVPESPKWLVSMKQYNKARHAIQRIARFNGVTNCKIRSFKQEEDARVARQGRNDDGSA